MSLAEIESLFPQGIRRGARRLAGLAQPQVVFLRLRMAMTNRLIYLDNAATTFPKPREVLETMLQSYIQMGVSPGRGSYDLALEAEDIVRDARGKLALFFGAPDPDRIIFASNATDALNIAFHGLLQPGDHVVSTRLEHNSVLRPLHHFRERGWISFDLVPFDARGFVDPGEIARNIKRNTRLVDSFACLQCAGLRSAGEGNRPRYAPNAGSRSSSMPRKAPEKSPST